MRTILIILCLQSIIFTADIRIDVHPDTIYVGSLVSILVTVENLNNNEVTLFQELEHSSDNFSIIDKLLSNNSAMYTLQFWDSGPVSTPAIIIDIMKFNQNVTQITTGKIKLNILSNISNGNNELREIKPMRDLLLTSTLLQIIFFIFLVIGIIVSYYLWRKRGDYQTSKILQGGYVQSNLQDTLRAIEKVPLPKKIDSISTEKYYLKLSRICRKYIKEQFYIKATEMTSTELVEYFIYMEIDKNLIDSWIQISSKADMAKYAKQIPPIDDCHKDKINYMNLIISFNKIERRSSGGL